MSVTVKESLTIAIKGLTDSGIPIASTDARILLAHAMDCEPSRLILIEDNEVPPDIFRMFEEYLAARKKFQPVSQIIGGREFWGRWFLVTTAVLDPRPETETLIDVALQNGPCQRILDLGTGSGILAVTLAAEWSDARTVAVDVSDEAIVIASKNAIAHGVAERVNIFVSNWFEKVEGRFDLIVANPPYITAAEMDELSPDVRNWEPLLALTPGGDGLESYRTIAATLDKFLANAGLALFEIGHMQGAEVVNIFKHAGFADVSIYIDMGGKDRVVSVKR